MRSSPPVLPPAPVDLMAVAVGGCQVILAWTECGTTALGFRIERAVGIGSAGPFSKIGGTGTRITAFRDGSARPCTPYSYRVLAWNAFGDSPASNVVEVKTSKDGTNGPPGQD